MGTSLSRRPMPLVRGFDLEGDICACTGCQARYSMADSGCYNHCTAFQIALMVLILFPDIGDWDGFTTIYPWKNEAVCQELRHLVDASGRTDELQARNWPE